MTKPAKIPIYLLPFLVIGTSDEYWFRRARDGRLGTVRAEPGRVRNRLVDTTAVESIIGPINDQQFEDAVDAYVNSRHVVRKVLP